MRVVIMTGDWYELVGDGRWAMEQAMEQGPTCTTA